MIRKLLNGDIDRVADIWLKTNLKAHYFISNQYWKSNYELVKEMMSQSEVYVYEEDKMIQGFVGLNAEYIEGIFVSVQQLSNHNKYSPQLHPLCIFSFFHSITSSPLIINFLIFFLFPHCKTVSERFVI